MVSTMGLRLEAELEWDWDGEMGCPRLGLHISARAVRSMVPRFAAAFHMDSGQDRVRRALVADLPTAGRGRREGYSQRTVRTAGEDSPLVPWPSWARQWYEPASVLETTGSRRLLLGPSRSRTPFRYQEKRVSGIELRLLLQLSVTACPSATSAAGLMRRRATSGRGREESSTPLHVCGSMPPTAGSPPGLLPTQLSGVLRIIVSAL